MHNKFLKFIRQIIIQFILLLMHPNLLMCSLTINLTEPVYGRPIQLQLNTFLEVLMQLRIYLVFMSIISNSIYCGTRATRLCRIYSAKNNLFFGVKALFEYKPLTFLILLYLCMVITLGQMISLSER